MTKSSPTGIVRIHSLPRDKRVSSGFTLLEMMLTVFLIGLAASMVVINTGQDNDDLARLEARRFAALVAHLQDEAVYTGLPMGIEISEVENRYRFWQLQDQWQRIERDQVLRERVIPDAIRFSFDPLQRAPLISTTSGLDGQYCGRETGSISVGTGSSQARSSQQNPDSENGCLPENLLLVEPSGLVQPFIVSFRGDHRIWKVFLDNQQNPVVSDEVI